MTFPDRHSLVRHLNLQRVLEDLIDHSPTTRVEIAERTGLSKPTVNALVRKLALDGVVREEGRTSGGLGRSATLYAFESTARLVVGVDLGGTKVRVGVADLSGHVLSEHVEPTDRRGGRAVISQIARIAQRLVQSEDYEWGRVVVTSLSAPGVFEPDSDHVDLAFNIPGFGNLALRRELETALGTPIIIDNDVNLAAIGEQWAGMARDVPDFAFVAVGTGIGMGLVTGGQLVRGARGAAGEIGYLPIGEDPFTHPEVRERGPLEEVAAASGIRAALRSALASGLTSRLSPEADVPEIFQAASEDDPAARHVIDQEARWLALAIGAIASVTDPSLFVLGGGIGSNPMLAPAVQAHLKTIAPFDIAVETSPLGDRASVIGAVATALAIARDRLFNEIGGDDE
ncbi:MAG: ROK family protein [Acidimicrobiia bacterium]